jgi:hypothetical protein
VSVVSLIYCSGVYINGRNSANLGLLIDKTSSIYLYVKLKNGMTSILKSCAAIYQLLLHMAFTARN